MNSFFRVALDVLSYSTCLKSLQSLELICDVDTYYVLQTFPYTGKTDRIEECIGDHVVMKLMNPYFDKPFSCQEAEKT